MVYEPKAYAFGFLVQKRKSVITTDFLFSAVGSGLSGSANGAGVCTGAAFDAGFRIDFVLAVAFADCRNRALCGTGTAADAIFRNFVSHNDVLLIKYTVMIQVYKEL